MRRYVDIYKHFDNIQKCDVTARVSKYNTPLHLSTIHGQLKVIQYLVKELKVEPNITELNQRVSLHRACEGELIDVIKYFIEAHKCDIMARDYNNDTPLNIASRHGQLKVVKYFNEELKLHRDITGFNPILPPWFM